MSAINAAIAAIFLYSLGASGLIRRSKLKFSLIKFPDYVSITLELKIRPDIITPRVFSAADINVMN